MRLLTIDLIGICIDEQSVCVYASTQGAAQTAAAAAEASRCILYMPHQTYIYKVHGRGIKWIAATQHENPLEKLPQISLVGSRDKRFQPHRKSPTISALARSLPHTHTQPPPRFSYTI